MNIFKHKLQYGLTKLLLPVGSQFLDFQVQDDYFVIWALAPIDTPLQERTILVCYTGVNNDIHSYDVYLGTVQHPDGLVYHAFDLL